MELQHINAKLLINNLGDSDLEPLIPVFHGWIKERAFGDLLLDVADYRHVHAGPGVMVIGQTGDYSVDNTDNRPGVRYNRKAPLEGTNQDRLRQATRAALLALQNLEGDPRLGGKLQFKGSEMEFFVNDRLLAPNQPATREASQHEFRAFFDKLFGGGNFSLSHGDDPRRLFGLLVKTERAFSAAQLLANLDS
jgi:hypothetical protein